MGPKKSLDGAESGICAEDGEPRGTALLLAYEFEGLLDGGVVNNRAELARRCGISRARVTQIMNLLKLPERVRSYLSALPEQQQTLYSERRLRPILAARDQEAQIGAFHKLAKEVEA